MTVCEQVDSQIGVIQILLFTTVMLQFHLMEFKPAITTLAANSMI